MKRTILITGCIMLTAVSVFADEKCANNVVTPKGAQSIVKNLASNPCIDPNNPVNGKVKVTGSATVSSLGGFSCNKAGKYSVNLQYAFPKSVTLERAVEVFRNPEYNNEAQKLFQAHRKPVVQNSQQTRIEKNATETQSLAANQASYYLDQESDIIFGTNWGHKRLRNDCTENTDFSKTKIWKRECKVLPNVASAPEAIEKGGSSFTNQCSQTTNGVTCFYTQTVNLLGQCKAVRSGVSIANMQADRTAYIQSAVAEMALSPGDAAKIAPAAYKEAVSKVTEPLKDLDENSVYFK